LSPRSRRAPRRVDRRAGYERNRMEGAEAGRPPLRQPLRSVRSRAVPAGARLSRLPEPRPDGRPQARQARQHLHLHARQPRPRARASAPDGGRRPRGWRAPLSPGDRRRRRRGEGRRARRADLPEAARGGRQPLLFLEGPSPGGAMKDRVAVIGIGCTKFGDRFERSYEELICDAAFEAYADAGIDPSEIEAAYLGTYLPGPGGGKAAVSLADALRL